jgi:hypothetical protein
LVLAVLGVLLLVCSASCASPPGRAATVWSDDFSDGDYAGWTVEAGTYTAVNYRLENMGNIINVIHHASTVAMGTWSFDLDIISPITGNDAEVSFLAIDLNPTTHYAQNGYAVEFSMAKVWLIKYVDGSPTTLASYYIGPNEGTVLRALEHVDVTRNTAGEMHVWVNGTHRLFYQDTTFSSSTYLVHDSSSSVAHYLDNVMVSDTIDLQPPTTTTNTTTTTTPIPGFAVPAITLGLVVALATAIVYRRRRP